MLAHSQAVVADLSSAVEAGRRRLATVNLKALQETASSVAHSALPGRISVPPPRRRRWPIAGFLVVGVAVLGFLYVNHLNPMIRWRAPGDDEPINDNLGPAHPTTAAALSVDYAYERDASDVVTGPVGSASLRDPASAPGEGADLERLPGVKLDPQ